jgi:hypothetical protein
MLTGQPAISRDGQLGKPCLIFDLRVTRRGGVQPAITLRRNGRITACGKCSLLLWLDPARSGADAGCVQDYAATGTPGVRELFL